MEVIIGVLVFVIAMFVVITVAKSIRTVPQQRMDVVERLGKYKRTLSPGLNCGRGCRSSCNRTCASRWAAFRPSP